METGTGMVGALIMEPRVDVTAMASIVRALIGDTGPARDVRWLHERTTAAGLGTHASDALEALRAHLYEGGTALSASIGDILSDLSVAW